MRRATAVLAALAAAATGAACATAPSCPGRGGPAWTQWKSTHFDLYTDLDAADAQLVVRDFEELRAALLVAAWRRAPEPRERAVLIVLRDEAERRLYLPGAYAAAVVTSAGLRAQYVLKAGVSRDDTVTHCLAFMLERHYGLRGGARWFDEGLASYLDPLTLAPDGALTYGQLNAGFYRDFMHGERLPFARLWHPAGGETERPFLATSWLAVHYLFNHEAARMVDFQRRLAAGEDGAAAWDAVFPDLTPDLMDERLADYAFASGQFLTFKAHLPAVAYTVTSRALDDATVHALRALLYATNQATPEPARPAVVRAEVAEALRLEPLQPLALFVKRAYLREDEADLEIPKRLIAREPDNALGWLILARARAARHELTEAREALEQVRAFAAATEVPVDLDLRPARPD